MQGFSSRAKASGAAEACQSMVFCSNQGTVMAALGAMSPTNSGGRRPAWSTITLRAGEKVRMKHIGPPTCREG
jgi:hypothetical protein